jgi:hypothetical protein
MVNIFRKWGDTLHSLANYKRCRRAIKEADRRKVTTGLKQLVIMYDGRPLVISKQRFKDKIRDGFFHKGFTPEKAEALAIYKTL